MKHVMYMFFDPTVDRERWNSDIPDLVGVTLTNRLGGEEEGAALDDGKTRGFHGIWNKYLAGRSAVSAVGDSHCEWKRGSNKIV